MPQTDYSMLTQRNVKQMNKYLSMENAELDAMDKQYLEMKMKQLWENNPKMDDLDRRIYYEQQKQLRLAWKAKQMQLPDRTDPLGPPKSELYPSHPDPNRNHEAKFRQLNNLPQLTTYASTAPSVQQRTVRSNAYLRPLERAAGHASGYALKPIPRTEPLNPYQNYAPADVHTEDGNFSFQDKHLSQHVFSTIDRSLKLNTHDDIGSTRILRK